MNTYVQDFVDHVIATGLYLNCFKKNLSGVMQDMGYPQLTDSNYSRNKHDILKVFSLETIIHELNIIQGLWLQICS